jgi:hypothetical protein
MNSESNFEKGSIIDHYNITSSLLKKIGINGEVGFLAEYHWHDAPCLSSAVTVAKMLLDEEIEVSDVMKFDISRDYHGVLKSALMWDSVHRTYGFLDKMRNTSS